MRSARRREKAREAGARDALWAVRPGSVGGGHRLAGWAKRDLGVQFAEIRLGALISRC